MTLLAVALPTKTSFSLFASIPTLSFIIHRYILQCHPASVKDTRAVTYSTNIEDHFMYRMLLSPKILAKL